MSRSMTKPTKWLVCPAKTQISLGICPVWPVFAVCLKKGWVPYPGWSVFAGQMPRLIWVFAGRTSFCWFCHAPAQMSHFTRKPVFVVFDQVRLKPACSATELICAFVSRIRQIFSWRGSNIKEDMSSDMTKPAYSDVWPGTTQDILLS